LLGLESQIRLLFAIDRKDRLVKGHAIRFNHQSKAYKHGKKNTIRRRKLENERSAKGAPGYYELRSSDLGHW